MTTRLKTLFQRPELFVLAGGINPIGAKMAEALGYDAFYMSGGNTSAHQLGWPDSGTSMRDMVPNASAGPGWAASCRSVRVRIGAPRS
jgi:2-methylisocitrate lyase-like PEP mutase family enzyme